MSQRVRFSASLLVLALEAAAPELFPAEVPADLLLRGGKIITVNSSFAVASSMAIREDRIVAVGSDADTAPFKGPRTVVLDLGGKCVLPGLIDSHCHPSAAAVTEMDHPRPPMESIGDVLRYFESRTKVLPRGEWIFLGQRFLTRLREHRYPTLEELDRAAPDHPVIFRTGPDCAVNAAALKAAGIGPDFAPPADSRAVAERDPSTGKLTGVFRNMNEVFTRRLRPESISREARLEAFKKMLAAYNGCGITSASDREVEGSDIETYEELLSKGALTVRICLSHSLDVSGDMSEIEARLRKIASLPVTLRRDPMLRLVAVKTYLDGGMLTGSAFMSQPWGVSEIYRISDPTYRGIQFIPDEKLAQIVEKAYDHGFQFVAHCQGDASVDALLRAYEALDREESIRDRRMCIGHGSFQRLDLVRRAAAIGVVADSQPAWLYLDASVLLRQFGKERLRYFIPLKTWFSEGGVVAGGSDHMIGQDPEASINLYSPFWGMWIAITRRARWVDEPVIPEEAISREQAIRLYTANAAFVELAEKEKGSLEVTKLADFIVIDRDILTCPVDEIRQIQVERTYLGGKLVYSKGR